MAPEPRRLFRNNSSGWLGVVLVTPTGAPEGAAVEPGGTVWLTEQECRLTAHAPRAAKDNPFVTQSYNVTNPETGEQSTVEVTPLTIVEDDREAPSSDRFVPDESGVNIGRPTPRADEQGDAPAPVGSPPVPTTPGLAPPPPPTPPAVQSAIEANQGAHGQETAAAEEPAQETGAAVEPPAEAPEGEYAAHEEVGTPDAPKPYVGEGE